MRKAQSAVSSAADDDEVVRLRALWRRYEHHCTRTNSCPSAMLRQDILHQIDRQEPLKKVIWLMKSAGNGKVIQVPKWFIYELLALIVKITERHLKKQLTGKLSTTLFCYGVQNS